MNTSLNSPAVLGVALDPLSLDEAVTRILELARQSSGKYVCFVDAHMLVNAHDNVNVRRALDGASLRLADGTPVSWCLRFLSHGARCVRGPEAMPALFESAQQFGLSVGFYGGSSDTLERMQARLKKSYPKLRVDYVYSPPFRALDPAERSDILNDIRRSGVRLLFVGLGCPKQELWMRENAAELSCVSLGVGAAFRIFAEETRLPPVWVMNAGLTWAVRFVQEPRRLFRRVFVHLPRFTGMVVYEAIRSTLNRNRSPQPG